LFGDQSCYLAGMLAGLERRQMSGGSGRGSPLMAGFVVLALIFWQL